MQRGPQQMHQQPPLDTFHPAQTSPHRQQEYSATHTNENIGTAGEPDHDRDGYLAGQL